MTAAGRLRRINSGSSGLVDTARCHGCGHLVRVHNVVGCVFGPCECAVTRAQLMPDAPRLEVPDGVVSTPAAAPAKPASPSAAAAPAPAVAPAAEAGPVGEPPAPVKPHWDPPKLSREALPAGPPPGWDPRAPKRDLGPHTPGAGLALIRAELPGLMPELTAEDEAEADALIAAAARQPLAVVKAPRRTSPRPAAPTAQGSRAVVGEDDVVEEVAASTSAATADPEPWAPGRPPAMAPVASGGFVRWEPVPSTVHATPQPLDIEPFLGAALHHYHAWYCTACFQRRHDPGACPECRRPLQPVHVIVYPRSLV